MKKPDIETKFGKVYFADCIEILKEVSFEKDQPILVCTDPPYLQIKDALGTHRPHSPKAYEKVPYEELQEGEYYELMKAWFEAAKKIAKWIGFTPGHKARNFWLNYEDFEELIWVNECRSGCSKSAHIRIHEPILAWGLGGSIKYMRSVFYCNTLGKETIQLLNVNHPCPKPSKLVDQLIYPLFIKMPSIIVLDPFLGSGCVGQVCESRGINWIGIEKVPAYRQSIEFRIGLGKKRFAETKSPLTRFLKKV